MADLIVSYVANSPTGTPYGHRIWSDGKAEGYQVARPVKQTDGSFKYQPIHPDFYPIATLSPEQVQAIQQETQQLQLATMRDHITTTGANKVDEGSIQWEVGVHGGVHKLRITPWPPAADDPVFALMPLIHRIGNIILAAQAGKHEVPA